MTFTRRCMLAAALALTGCATVPVTPPAPNPIDSASDWPARRAALLALREFALRGRVAVAAADEGFNAALRWRQRGEPGEIQLDGPLGMGAMHIEFDTTHLRVTDARGVARIDAQARAEIERRLGFALPLAELSYWVRGVAAPGGSGWREELNAEGTHLAALEQDGWRVQYTAYAATALGGLPQKLTAQRPGCRLRLLIDAWSAP